MIDTDDIRHHTEVGTGYSKDAQLGRAADEIDRLRKAAGDVVAAFEELGRVQCTVTTLRPWAKCETALLAMKSILPV